MQRVHQKAHAHVVMTRSRYAAAEDVSRQQEEEEEKRQLQQQQQQEEEEDDEDDFDPFLFIKNLPKLTPEMINRKSPLPRKSTG